MRAKIVVEEPEPKKRGLDQQLYKDFITFLSMAFQLNPNHLLIIEDDQGRNNLI